MSNINPMWFYRINVMGNIHTFCEIACFFACVAFIVAAINKYFEDEGTWVMVASAFVMIISGLLVIFLPSKQTLIEMKLAESETIDAIKSAAEYIIKAAK